MRCAEFLSGASKSRYPKIAGELLISCRGLRKELGEKIVFKDVNLDIATGDRIGLIGRNGGGKKTLVNILFGKEQADQGSIIRHQKNTRIGYLLQTAAYTENRYNPAIMSNNHMTFPSF